VFDPLSQTPLEKVMNSIHFGVFALFRFDVTSAADTTRVDYITMLEVAPASTTVISRWHCASHRSFPV
jgi:hypothetical protein